MSAERLRYEKDEKCDGCNPSRVCMISRRDDIQALNGRENRDCRCDDAIAVEKAGRQDEQKTHCAEFRSKMLGSDLREERENAPFSMMVCVKDEGDVFYRDDESQCPDGQ